MMKVKNMFLLMMLPPLLTAAALAWVMVFPNPMM